MAQKAKEQLTQVAARLRDAATRQDPLALAFIELLQLSIEDLKDSLVTAVDSDMLKTQGAVQQLLKLHKELTVIPPTIRPTETRP